MTPENDALYRKVMARARALRREARACAKAGAYVAANVMAGAALEGLLLATAIRCNEIENEADLRRMELWPPGGDPLRWSLDALVRLAALEGWLSAFNVYGDELESQAEVLQWLRNLVHPGAWVREPPNFPIDERLHREMYGVLQDAFTSAETFEK